MGQWWEFNFTTWAINSTWSGRRGLLKIHHSEKTISLGYSRIITGCDWNVYTGRSIKRRLKKSMVNVRQKSKSFAYVTKNNVLRKMWNWSLGNGEICGAMFFIQFLWKSHWNKNRIHMGAHFYLHHVLTASSICKIFTLLSSRLSLNKQLFTDVILASKQSLLYPFFQFNYHREHLCWFSFFTGFGSKKKSPGKVANLSEWNVSGNEPILWWLCTLYLAKCIKCHRSNQRVTEIDGPNIHIYDGNWWEKHPWKRLADT